MKADNRLMLLFAMAGWATCATASAQTVIGSPGAGFQNWTAADLNNNGAPFWDAPTLSFGDYSSNQDSKNVGFCLTGTGDCVGIGSAASAPGPLPYWGLPYDSVNDKKGALDPKVYFRRDGAPVMNATLQLQLSTVPTELNEFGWFETNAQGSTVGPMHALFRGSGVPPGTAMADPVGKSVTFRPTPYYGYYFKDVSEAGCLAYTLYNFNDTAGCSTHVLVVFADNAGGHTMSAANSQTSSHVASPTAFWIGAIDPPGCFDGDCNLTLVKVNGVESH